MLHAPEGLRILEDLRRNGDLIEFRDATQIWSANQMKWFNGYSGQMFINQLVNSKADPQGLTTLLPEVLSPPIDDDHAYQKIRAMTDFVEKIRVGSHPASGHIPFCLSFLWGLADPSRPVAWKSATYFVEVSTGEALPTEPSARYARYVELVRELDTDYRRYEDVTGWWDRQTSLFLDVVLSDRCEFGWKVLDEEHARRLSSNARALGGIAKHLGAALKDELSEFMGRDLRVGLPSMSWKPGRPRSDLLIDWRVPEQYAPGLRLWLNHLGMTICASPGIGPPEQYGGKGTEKRWYDKTAEVVNRLDSEGFEITNCQGANRGEDRGFLGRAGSFVYGRWYGRDQLQGLDLRSECRAIVPQLRPILDKWIDLYHGSPPNGPPPPGDPLAGAVEEFVRDTGYPTAKDEEQRAHQSRFREMLLTENLSTARLSQLRRIWTSGDYGYPGIQSYLAKVVDSADDSEYQRILATFDYVCWGDADDDERIDNVLKDPAYRVKGLGESVTLKLLAICHPDRYFCVFPYSGEKGKLRMLKALDLPEPPKEATRGHKHVESNDRLRKRLERFFPGDPWGMMCFLYWYVDWDGLGTQTPDPIDAAASELLIDRTFLDDIVGLLEDKGQVILYGPPGTGKTFLAQRLAEALTPDSADRALVQFHPSTSYEDFFEGYRPDEGPDGQIVYRLVRGPLARIADRAAAYPHRRQVMIIDEINRANLPKVLGELLFLLEYRKRSISTLYRPEAEFELPESLWFIGTMNTADRSIALVDAALRRRFHFVPFFPDRGPTEGLLDRWLEREGEPAWVAKLVKIVNKELTEAIGADLQLGPSHFMKPGYLPAADPGDERLRRIWEYNIEPLIEDQLFGDPGRIGRFRFESVMARYLSSSRQIDPADETQTAGDQPDPDARAT